MLAKRYQAFVLILALSFSAGSASALSLRSNSTKSISVEVASGSNLLQELRTSLMTQINTFAASVSSISSSLPTITVAVSSANDVGGGLSALLQAIQTGSITFNSMNATQIVLGSVAAAMTRVQSIVNGLTQFIGMSVNGSSTAAVRTNIELNIQQFAMDLQNLTILSRMNTSIAGSIEALQNFSSDALNGLSVDFIPASEVTTTAANFLCATLTSLPGGSLNIPYPSFLNNLVPAVQNASLPFIDSQNALQNTMTANSLRIAREQTAAIINELQVLSFGSSGSLQSRLQGILNLTKEVDNNLQQISFVKSFVTDLNSSFSNTPGSVGNQIQNLAGVALSGETVQTVFPGITGLWDASTILGNPPILSSNIISDTPSIFISPFIGGNATSDQQNVVASVANQLGNLAINAEKSGTSAVGTIADGAVNLSQNLGKVAGMGGNSGVFTFLTPFSGNNSAGVSFGGFGNTLGSIFK